MSDQRRRLPPVHALLADAEAAGVSAPREVLRDAVRAVLEAARARGGETPIGGC